MLDLISNSKQCIDQNSPFSFIVEFMRKHEAGFHAVCFLCPFSYCYRYFIAIFAVFQIVCSLKELSGLLSNVGAQDNLLLTIPYWNIPVSHHNFDMMRHSLNLSSCFDLLVRTMTSESASELVTFTAISFATFIYSLACYIIKLETLSSEQRTVQFVMNMASILNLMFLMCFIYENCKSGI